MVKKDDGNDLSLLDGPQVLKDVHNRDDRALNVTAINEIIPKAFSRIEVDYVLSGYGIGEVGEARYYSNGKKENTIVQCRNDYQGEPEFTTINTAGISAPDLAGTYFLIQDDIGSVGVWFDVDNTSMEPITGALRNIEVDIATSDTYAQTALKLATTLNTDPKFIGTSSSSYAYLTASVVGNLLNAQDFNTNLSISIQDGASPSSLNNKYFYANSANNAIQYYIWYNVDTLGTDPAIGGKTGIEVAISGNAQASTIATLTAIAMNATEKFNCVTDSNNIHINTVRGGLTTMSTDVNTGFNVRRLEAGEDRKLIATLFLTYNSNNELTSVERED
jgi:hypothetical protein